MRAAVSGTARSTIAAKGMPLMPGTEGTRPNPAHGSVRARAYRVSGATPRIYRITPAPPRTESDDVAELQEIRIGIRLRSPSALVGDSAPLAGRPAIHHPAPVGAPRHTRLLVAALLGVVATVGATAWDPDHWLPQTLVALTCLAAAIRISVASRIAFGFADGFLGYLRDPPRPPGLQEPDLEWHLAGARDDPNGHGERPIPR